ncbi:hypothetical protein ACA910_009606 [Epithemia clementina (nom. ined.)]
MEDSLSRLPVKGNVFVHQQVNGKSLGQLAHRIPVDVVLIDGKARGRSNDIWLGTGVRLVVWLNRKSCSGPPKDLSWQNTTFTLQHGDLGEASNGVIWLHVAELSLESIALKGHKHWFGQSPDVHVGLTSVVLKGVLDSTVKGPTAPAPLTVDDDSQWNNVAMKNLRKRHVLPSVFSSMGFVRRLLTPKEQALVNEFPAWLIKSNAEETLSRSVEINPTPFKIRAQAVWRIHCHLDETTLEPKHIGNNLATEILL